MRNLGKCRESGYNNAAKEQNTSHALSERGMAGKNRLLCLP